MARFLSRQTKIMGGLGGGAATGRRGALWPEIGSSARRSLRVQISVTTYEY